MLQLYLDPCTINCRKVLAGVALLGTPNHLNNIDYFGGEHKSDDYLKINPNATIPSAVDGDCTITESNAILQYAADLGSSGDDSAYPKDNKKRANVNRWLLWEASSWFPSCYVYLVEFVVKPLLGDKPDQSVIEAQSSKWNQLAKVLDDQLAKTKYIAGDSITIADIAIASPMHLPEASQFPLDKHPNLKRWLKEYIEPLPCWKETQGAVEAALLPNSKSASSNGNSNGNGTTGRPANA